MTLNQIVTNLEAIATNHRQVNTFGFGDIWEVASSGDITYPLMWATLDGIDVSTSEKKETYKFSLLFMDVVKGGEVNELEVLSDQLSIAKDVLAQLKHPSYDWNFQNNNSSLEDFTERFVDSVSGWKMNISLELPFSSDRCAMPYTGNTSTSQGYVTIFSFDGSVFTTVSNGGSYTLGEDMTYRKITLTSGAINGVNTIFVFEETPVQVVFNGSILLPTTDYTLVGNTVTLNFIPLTGESVVAYGNY